MTPPAPPVSTTPGGFKYAAESPRLYLQELSVEEHLEHYHNLWSNPANLVTLHYPALKTVEESRARMITATLSTERPWVEDYAIFLKPTSTSPKPQWIGFVGVIREIQKAPPELDVNGAPEFGYMLDVAHQSKGFGTEAVRAFVDLYWRLERRKGEERLVALVNRRNVGSVKVIERLDGERVGVLDGEKEGDVWVVRRPSTSSK